MKRGLRSNPANTAGSGPLHAPVTLRHLFVVVWPVNLPSSDASTVRASRIATLVGVQIVCKPFKVGQCLIEHQLLRTDSADRPRQMGHPNARQHVVGPRFGNESQSWCVQPNRCENKTERTRNSRTHGSMGR
jgi:hypothetical protein